MTYGLTIEEIRKGIESLQSVSGRFHIIEAPNYTVTDDCYNANPISMKASLDVLTDALGRKVAILGDMGELGADERKITKKSENMRQKKKLMFFYVWESFQKIWRMRPGK